MSALAPLLFIARATLKNMLLRQARRLRQPRYLAATAMGLFYVWGIFARHGMTPRSVRLTMESTVMAAFLLAFPLVLILWTWLFGGDEASLSFSEAEIQFLFPAPLTRNQLVHYKLARTLLFSAFTALLVTVGFGQRVGAPLGRFFVAAWLGVATLGLHNIAASLTRASLLQRGTSAPARRLVALLIPAALAACAIAAFLGSPSVPPHPVELQRWFHAFIFDSPLRWASLPFRPAIELALRPGETPAALALAGALLSLAVHYAWALSTGADFQDGALAAAEKRGRRLEQRRKGHLPLRAARAPWKLAPSGHPTVAIFWKNLTAAVRLLSLRVTIALGLAALALLVPVLFTQGEVRRILAAGALTLLAGYFTLFGTQILRIDFRLDLPNIDLLRTLPLRGWHIAAGEVLAPVAVLTVAQWLCLASAAAVVPASSLDGASRVAVAAALALLLPPVNLCLVIVQNGAALIFPAWVAAGVQGARGIEAMGQRLLTLAGTLLVVGIGLVPAAIAGLGAVALVGLFSGFGSLALVLGAAAASAVLLGEGAFGVLYLGRLFERFDLGLT